MGTDKDAFAREMLVSKGMDASQITEAALPGGETFHKRIELTGETPEALPRLLHGTHNIGMTWCFFAGVFSLASA